MKLLRRTIRRLILENSLKENAGRYETLGKLMSDPLKNPAGWLQGFRLGIDAELIKVLSYSPPDGLKPESYEQYTVDIPFAISQHFYSDIHLVKRHRNLGFWFVQQAGGILTVIFAKD